MFYSEIKLKGEGFRDVLTVIGKSWNFHNGKLIQKYFWNFYFRVVKQAVLLEIHPLKSWVPIHLFQFWGGTQTVLLENSSIRFYDWNHDM